LLVLSVTLMQLARELGHGTANAAVLSVALIIFQVRDEEGGRGVTGGRGLLGGGALCVRRRIAEGGLGRAALS
jgi:hypothetical protein